MSKKKLSVAIVTSIHPDFDARIWKHARLLATAGLDVHLICPWNVEPNSVVDGVTFHPFSKVTSRSKRVFQIPIRLLPPLVKIIRNVDIIHFHDIDILPWMAFFSLFKTVVYDVHENYPEEMLVRDWVPNILRTPLYYLVRYVQQMFSFLVRNIVLVAPSQEASFNFKYFRKIYLYNFASKALMSDAKDDYENRKDVVVFIGSQHNNNGSLLLLDIVEETIKRLPNIKFLATDRFSNQVFRDFYIKEIGRRHLDDSLRLIPNVKPHELMGVLNGATIGISPNLRVKQQIDGIHTKIFEYMCAGIPMVVSDLPHQEEVINHSQAGILAQPESVDSFVSGIERLVNDREYARLLGLNGQKAFLEDYCYESQESSLINFYKLITNE